MSESDRNIIIGEWTSKYSEAKRRAAQIKEVLKNTGLGLFQLGQQLKDGNLSIALERFDHTAHDSRADLERVRALLQEWQETEAHIKECGKTLSDMGITF